MNDNAHFWLNDDGTEHHELMQHDDLGELQPQSLLEEEPSRTNVEQDEHVTTSDIPANEERCDGIYEYEDTDILSGRGASVRPDGDGGGNSSDELHPM